MQVQSNFPLSTVPKRWNEDSFIVYFDHKDNGLQEEGKEGGRYTARYVIVKSLDEDVIKKAIEESSQES
jgi:hypothetical protein